MSERQQISTSNVNDDVQLLLFEDSQASTRKFVLFDEILPLRVKNYEKTFQNPQLSIEINSVSVYDEQVVFEETHNNESNTSEYRVSNIKEIFQDSVYQNSTALNQGRKNVIRIGFHYLVPNEKDKGNTSYTQEIPEPQGEQDKSNNTDNGETKLQTKNNLMSFEPISPFIESSQQLPDNRENGFPIEDTPDLDRDITSESTNEISPVSTEFSKKSIFKTMPIYSVLYFKLKNISMSKPKKNISSLEIQPSKTLRDLNTLYGDKLKNDSDIFLQIEEISYYLIKNTCINLKHMGQEISEMNKNIKLSPEKVFNINYELPYEPLSSVKICINYLVSYGANNKSETIRVQVSHKTKVVVDMNKHSPVTIAPNALSSRSMSPNHNMRSLGYNYATQSASSLLLPPAHTALYDNTYAHTNSQFPNSKMQNRRNQINKHPIITVTYKPKAVEEGNSNNTVFASMGVPFKVTFQLKYENSERSVTDFVVYQSINIPTFNSNSKQSGRSTSNTSRGSNGVPSASTTGMVSPIRMSELYMANKRTGNNPSIKPIVNHDFLLSNTYYKWKKSLAQLPYQNGIVLLTNDYRIVLESIPTKTMDFQVEFVGLQKGYYPNVHGLRIVSLDTGDVISFGTALAVMVV